MILRLSINLEAVDEVDFSNSILLFWMLDKCKELEEENKYNMSLS